MPSAKRIRSMPSRAAGAALRLGAEAHPAGGRPGVDHHLLVVHVQEPGQRAPATDEHTITAGPGKPIGPHRGDLRFNGGG